MKTRILLSASLMLLSQLLQAQYKNDNIAFKTVYMEDLCNQLQKNPGHIILDVRSKGEYHDSSSSPGSNIGRLRGAMHMDIMEIQERWKELLPHKNKTIFVYCSHSQRSRRVSKFLADSGFANIVNINSGMTGFNQFKNSAISCSNGLYETANRYHMLMPAAAAKLISATKDLFILDVRSDSAFRGISTDESRNACGTLKGALNIPFSELPASLAKLPRNKDILVIDDFGFESGKAANLLLDNGFTRVNYLYSGMDLWRYASREELPQKNELWVRTSAYELLTAVEFDESMSAMPATTLLDIRTTDEYHSRSKENWRNRGRLRGATHIPLDELAKRSDELNAFKQQQIIVYGLGGGGEAYAAAKILTGQGFTRVSVLVGGLWNLRWKAANIKGLERLMSRVVDTPADNF